MSLLGGCIADAEQHSFADFSHLEDEEAQISAIFNEAIALKRQVREMTVQLAESESQRQAEMVRMDRVVKEKDDVILEMARRNEDTNALREELLSKTSQDNEIQNLRRKLNERSTISPTILGMQGKISLLEEELRRKDEDHRHEKVTLTTQVHTATRSCATQTVQGNAKDRQLAKKTGNDIVLAAKVRALLKDVNHLKFLARRHFSST